MKSKTIIIGEIEKETVTGTPIEVFQKAVELSKKDSFVVYTNNPQLIEALEVLCGIKNVDVMFLKDYKLFKISFLKAYNYIGDIYDIIDSIRFCKEMDIFNPKSITKDIEFYNEKYKKFSKKVKTKNYKNDLYYNELIKNLKVGL